MRYEAEPVNIHSCQPSAFGGRRWRRVLGDCSEGVTPVPIPNTEVKPLSPDMPAQMRGRVGHCPDKNQSPWLATADQGLLVFCC